MRKSAHTTLYNISYIIYLNEHCCERLVRHNSCRIHTCTIHTHLTPRATCWLAGDPYAKQSKEWRSGTSADYPIAHGTIRASKAPHNALIKSPDVWIEARTRACGSGEWWRRCAEMIHGVFRKRLRCWCVIMRGNHTHTQNERITIFICRN